MTTQEKVIKIIAEAIEIDVFKIDEDTASKSCNHKLPSHYKK